MVYEWGIQFCILPKANSGIKNKYVRSKKYITVIKFNSFVHFVISVLYDFAPRFRYGSHFEWMFISILDY